MREVGREKENGEFRTKKDREEESYGGRKKDREGEISSCGDRKIEKQIRDGVAVREQSYEMVM